MSPAGDNLEVVGRTALVLIDESNLHYGSITAGWSLDFKKFLDWLSKEFSIIEGYIFAGIISKKAYFDKHPDARQVDFSTAVYKRRGFFTKLKSYGFSMRTKPVASIYDSTSGRYKLKCNCDVEIAIMAIDKLDHYDELILCSGDGDFEKLVKYIKNKNKKVTVICYKDRLNRGLANSANRAIYYKTIRKEVEKT